MNAASMPAGTAGGPDALRSLYAEHWVPLVDYVTRLIRDRHQAEDIAQETMLRAWCNAESLTPERGSIRGWLRRVAHNITMDRIRARRARPTEVNETAATGGDGATADHAEDVVSALHVANMLARLSPAHRAVLHQVYFANRTCAETADELGIPIGTVKSRLYHALRRLRADLDRQRLIAHAQSARPWDG
jgi:RNA polymerase sigma-70 factor (ECF subfamily)